MIKWRHLLEVGTLGAVLLVSLLNFDPLNNFLNHLVSGSIPTADSFLINGGGH